MPVGDCHEQRRERRHGPVLYQLAPEHVTEGYACAADDGRGKSQRKGIRDERSHERRNPVDVQGFAPAVGFKEERPLARADAQRIGCVICLVKLKAGRNSMQLPEAEETRNNEDAEQDEPIGFSPALHRSFTHGELRAARYP